MEKLLLLISENEIKDFKIVPSEMMDLYAKLD